MVWVRHRHAYAQNSLLAVKTDCLPWPSPQVQGYNTKAAHSKLGW